MKYVAPNPHAKTRAPQYVHRSCRNSFGNPRKLGSYARRMRTVAAHWKARSRSLFCSKSSSNTLVKLASLCLGGGLGSGNWNGWGGGT
eukprot:5933915-Pleurochrysis_carterae.AAC.1